MPELAYRAVFFDVGETLLAPHPSFNELFSEIMGGLGYEVTPGDVEEALATVAPSVGEVKLLLEKQFPEKSDVSIDEMLSRIRQALSRGKKLPCTLIVLDEVQQGFDLHRLKRLRLHAFEHVKNVFRAQQ